MKKQFSWYSVWYIPSIFDSMFIYIFFCIHKWDLYISFVRIMTRDVHDLHILFTFCVHFTYIFCLVKPTLFGIFYKNVYLDSPLNGFEMHFCVRSFNAVYISRELGNKSAIQEKYHQRPNFVFMGYTIGFIWCACMIF